jgi:hypothetical protein
MLRTIRQRAGQLARTQGPAGLSPRARRLTALAAAVAGGLAMPLLAGACSVSVGPLQHRTSSYSAASRCGPWSCVRTWGACTLPAGPRAAR